MTTRLIQTQKHADSCGPIAIMNIIKLLGGSIAYKDLKMFEGFGYRYNAINMGMNPYDLAKCLNSLGCKVEKWKEIKSVKLINESMDKGNMGILLYSPNMILHHFAVLYGQTPKMYYTCNYFGNRASFRGESHNKTLKSNLNDVIIENVVNDKGVWFLEIINE